MMVAFTLSHCFPTHSNFLFLFFSLMNKQVHTTDGTDYSVVCDLMIMAIILVCNHARRRYRMHTKMVTWEKRPKKKIHIDQVLATLLSPLPPTKPTKSTSLFSFIVLISLVAILALCPNHFPLIIVLFSCIHMFDCVSLLLSLSY